MPRITSFSLENFRVFEQKTTFEFAPITILTGANNSGKSSVFKALNLLSENAKAEKQDFFTQLDFSLGNHNLGDYENALNYKQKEKDNNIQSYEIGFSVFVDKEKNELIFSYEDVGYKSEIEKIDFKLEVQFSKSIIHKITLKDTKNEVIFSIYDKLYQNGAVGVIYLNFEKIFNENALGKIFDNSKMLKMEVLDKYIGNHPDKDKFLELLREKILDIWREESRGVPELGLGESYQDYHFYDFFGDYELHLHVETLICENEFNRNMANNFYNYYEILKNDKLSEDELEEEKSLFLEKMNDGFEEDFWKTYERLVENKVNFMGNFNKEPLLNKEETTDFYHILKDCDFLRLSEILNIDFYKVTLTSIDETIKNILIFCKNECFKNFEFVESIKINTQRIFFTNQSQGTSFNDALKMYQLNKLNISFNKPNFLTYWLKEFGIADNIEINNIKGIAYEIILYKNGQKRDLADLGFGISQILALIIKIYNAMSMSNKFSNNEIFNWNYSLHAKDADIKKKNGEKIEKVESEENIKLPKKTLIYDYAKPFNTSICIEEPETNLHPKLQSKLADMLIGVFDMIKKDSNLSGVQFIIETHSEYFIRKLQYWVAKKEIQSEDVNIYYLYNPDEIPKGHKQVERIRIEEDGSLDNDFGTGFFDEADNISIDIFNLQHHKN